MSGRRAIVFCHGVRTRTLRESGGEQALGALFDVFVDVSPVVKPWEYKQGYDDLTNSEKVVRLNDSGDIQTYFSDNIFDYVLVVGLEWSVGRRDLLQAVTRRAGAWGILFVRGDLRDLFGGRHFDERWIYKPRKLLRKFRKRNKAAVLPPPRHYFSNEPRARLFPEVLNDHTGYIPCNHADYYGLCEANTYSCENRIVFLDQAIPYTFFDNEENIVYQKFYDEDRRNRYFYGVNEYLLQMADSLKTSVSVCLHPNAPNFFSGFYSDQFEIHRGDTIGQVASASFVVTHGSMATGFCHLLQKPTALLRLSPDLLPAEIRRQIGPKAANEGLCIHDWPTRRLPAPPYTVAANRRIREFLAPVPDQTSLGKLLQDVIPQI